MKFVFPKNYKFSSKLFGIIDYSSAIIILIFGIFLFFILNTFINDFSIKIFVFISFVFPFILFVIVNNSKENIFFTILYIVKFFYNRNVYLYYKNINYSSNKNSKKAKFLKKLKIILENLLKI